jgi:hypothetical protein
MKERRRSRRRSLPFVRNAVLEVDGQTHIVAVQDLGSDGAFLTTPLAVTAAQQLRLRIVLPRSGREAMMPCQLVWRSDHFDAATGRPAGVAVRFVGLDDDGSQRASELAAEGLIPAPSPAAAEHYEYRLIERPEPQLEELNQLGLDGWRLAAAVPSKQGLKLVLLRKL